MNWRIKIRFILKVFFYSVTVIFSGPFFFKLTAGINDNYFTSSISFNLDTLYLNWNTTFPAVTVCEIYNGEKIWDISEEYFGQQHDLQIDDIVGEIVFFRGTCTTCQKCEQLKCPVNFTEMLHVFRAKCSQLIMNCSYINKYFDCCDEFLPIRTEYGICFSFNSYQAHATAQTPHANNRVTGPGQLQFDAITDIQLHVHPPIEIPFLFSEGIVRETVLLGTIKEVIINVMELYNDLSIDRLTPQHRRCRFSKERTEHGEELGLYEFYSYSTCIVECTLNIQMLHCNCTSHMLTFDVKDYRNPVCDYTGLECLTAHYEEILWERKSCDCLSSCEEPEYNIVFNSADQYNQLSTDKAKVIVSLMQLPTERYVRRVTKNFLDFIISVGGVAGLFFNASLIRVIEVFFVLSEFKWSSLLSAWRSFWL